MLLVNQGALESVVQFVTALLIFVFVLVITYLTSRYIASFQKQSMTGRNIEVIETTKLTPNKYLQIIRAGDQYLLIAVCKDTVTMLAQLDGDNLIMEKTDSTLPLEFGDILKKAKHKLSGGSTDKEQEKTDEKDII